MHSFDYSVSPSSLLLPDVVNLLTALYEEKGRQELYFETAPEILNALKKQALVESSQYANSILGRVASNERLRALVTNKTVPEGKPEEEIAGYSEVLSSIFNNYGSIVISSSSIMQLHKLLFSYSASVKGGVFKIEDEVLVETCADGSKFERFRTVSAADTLKAVDELCENFNQAIARGEHDPLLLISQFALDFLCIHPFTEGSGRISRLLVLLLLYKSGFFAGMYVSLERILELSRDVYYDALRQCSVGWHENTNDYLPFVRYFLGLFLKVYRDFNDRVALCRKGNLSKSDRIWMVFDKKVGQIKKSDILAFCPDVSQTTIERTLAELLRQNLIVKVGNGRGAAYLKNINISNR